MQCVAEMPTVQKLYDHYRNDPDVEFLIVSRLDSPLAVGSYAYRSHLDLPFYVTEVLHFDVVGATNANYDWQIDTSPEALAAFKAMADDPYFNQRATLPPPYGTGSTPPPAGLPPLPPPCALTEALLRLLPLNQVLSPGALGPPPSPAW